MKVNFEFHEKDKSIHTEDIELSTEQLVALYNSKVILFPLEKRGNVRGEIYETSFNPIIHFCLVRIKEID